VSGRVKFTAAAARDRATISRGRLVYASGTSVALGAGRRLLLLDKLRPLHHGRYRLALHSHHHGHPTTHRVTVAIGYTPARRGGRP
jgi:hypothetical protein